MRGRVVPAQDGNAIHMGIALDGRVAQAGAAAAAAAAKTALEARNSFERARAVRALGRARPATVAAAG